LSAVRTLFRHCPSCGHRFRIRLVSKSGIGDEGVNNPSDYATDWEWWNENDVQLHTEHITDVNAFIPVVEVKAIEYNYVCKRCGHKWSEKATKTIKMPSNPDYKGD
jgi:hypothetical protein